MKLKGLWRFGSQQENMAMPAASFALTQIGQIAIPVRDLERAVNFYGRALGMQHLFTASSLAFFDCGGIRLMLSVPEAPEFDHPGSIIYFSVADIKVAHQALIAQGVQFVDEPHVIADMGTYDLWMAFFRDSEHNLLGIMGEVPHAQAA
jgi:methylmalonyl-CoA/ethylmalonyl-CoA epimerase